MTKLATKFENPGKMFLPTRLPGKVAQHDSTTVSPMPYYPVDTEVLQRQYLPKKSEIYLPTLGTYIGNSEVKSQLETKLMESISEMNDERQAKAGLLQK
jgi:hypothetical protein